jgi:hypothetical protein
MPRIVHAGASGAAQHAHAVSRLNVRHIHTPLRLPVGHSRRRRPVRLRQLAACAAAARRASAPALPERRSDHRQQRWRHRRRQHAAPRVAAAPPHMERACAAAAAAPPVATYRRRRRRLQGCSRRSAVRTRCHATSTKRSACSLMPCAHLCSFQAARCPTPQWRSQRAAVAAGCLRAHGAMWSQRRSALLRTRCRRQRRKKRRCCVLP